MVFHFVSEEDQRNKEWKTRPSASKTFRDREVKSFENRCFKGIDIQEMLLIKINSSITVYRSLGTEVGHAKCHHKIGKDGVMKRAWTHLERTCQCTQNSTDHILDDSSTFKGIWKIR